MSPSIRSRWGTWGGESVTGNFKRQLEDSGGGASLSVAALLEESSVGGSPSRDPEGMGRRAQETDISLH